MLRKTKKSLELLANGKQTITRELLLTVGFFVNDTGYIINQDTGAIFEYNGRYLRTTLFGNSMLHHGDTEFDIFNTKMIVGLFNFVVNRSTSEDGIYYRMYHDDKLQEGDNIKSSLIVGSSEGELRSNYYINDSYKYIDIIYQICNQELQIEHLLQYDLEDYKVR